MPNETFGDLVSMARALDAAGVGDSTHHCLLGWSSFDADLAVPLHPLPDAWTDASTALAAHPDGVYVFSTRGPSGQPSPLTIVPFTRIRPSTEAVAVAVLFLTPRGVWARPGHELLDEPAAPVPLADVPREVALLHEPLGAILVTADAATPLVRVRALLSRLAPLHVPVALAVPLPVGAVLERPPIAAADRAATCPHGLPSAPPGTLVGDLPLDSSLPVLSSWASATAACTPHTLQPGDLTVDLRIAGDGTVSLACAQVDTFGDADVRRCILDVVRGSHFPPPDPTGSVVELAYPVRIPRPGLSDAQEPLCAEPTVPPLRPHAPPPPQP